MLHLTPLKSLLLASALALLAAAPASAQEKFRVITTFTVIADMAQNVVNVPPSSTPLPNRARRSTTSLPPAISNARRGRS